MIDKDKLIESCEMTDSENREWTSFFTREQIDWLCENQHRFINQGPKPYEVRIDFSPVVIDILSLITELKNRVENLEHFAKHHHETSLLNLPKMGDNVPDCSEL